MEANPWAAVLFILSGVVLFGFGLTSPTIIAIWLVVFAVGWFAAGYLWDWLTLRKK